MRNWIANWSMFLASIRQHGRFTRLLRLAALGLAALLVSCRLFGPTPTPDPKSMAADIHFSIAVSLSAVEKTQLSLAVENTASRRFPGDEQFNGTLEIRETSQDQVRGSAELKELPPLEPGEKQTLMEWAGQLDPGNYQVTWGGPDYEPDIVQFQIP
jgi:hypothetical protein